MYMYGYIYISITESLHTSFLQYLSAACTMMCVLSLEAGWLWAWFLFLTRESLQGRVDRKQAQKVFHAAALP
jgi:hypothetical protein